MSKRQFLIGLIFASLFGGLVALGGYKLMEKEPPNYESVEHSQNVHFSNYLSDSSFTVPDGLNFEYAAAVATPAVVHIKSTINNPQNSSAYNSPFEDMFKDFFGDPRNFKPMPEKSAGSGVIISPDGYIVTNNHVIDQADDIEVSLYDNRNYKAKLVGTDPSTDLAVLKIDASNLPYMKYGNSDDAKVGQWVLAVGNPFDLTSTVTAGIISAKARNIAILKDKYGIESFLQTDAAVNPGNSGGALVDLKGQLIGITAAIATPTGTYAGYAFAVPESLVKKVAHDLIEFGAVQRAVLGISIVDVNDPRLKDDHVKEHQGVYVMDVNPKSAAEAAGLKKGDVIIAINDNNVINTSELQEQVARHRPGDEITVTYIRDGKTKTVNASLKNLDNEVKIVRNTGEVEIEGGTFRNLTDKEKEDLKLDGGVKITALKDGKWKNAGVRDGFIITAINKRPVSDVNDLRSALRGQEGEGILIGGVYPNGEEAYYGIGW